MTGCDDLDEWALAGLTSEQGLARWSGLFAGRPSVLRMTVSTGWGWLVWEPGDAEAAHVARLAGRVPPPVLVEIAVGDPDWTGGRLSPRSSADPVTSGAWSGLAGLITGAAAGVRWWGVTTATSVLAVAVAAGGVAAAALWRWSARSGRQHVRILTERDAAAADVFAGAKVLTWVTDQVRIHRSANVQRHQHTGETHDDQPSEFSDAVYQLRRALWALAAGRVDDPRATLTAMTEYAGRVLELIDARDRVRRASVIRVAAPARPNRGADSAVERLRDAARRLDAVIDAQRHAAEVIGDINRRFDEAW